MKKDEVILMIIGMLVQSFGSAIVLHIHLFKSDPIMWQLTTAALYAIVLVILGVKAESQSTGTATIPKGCHDTENIMKRINLLTILIGFIIGICFIFVLSASAPTGHRKTNDGRNYFIITPSGWYIICDNFIDKSSSNYSDYTGYDCELKVHNVALCGGCALIKEYHLGASDGWGILP